MVSYVFIAACAVGSSYILYLEVVSIVDLSYPILCPVVCEWKKSVV